MVVVAASEDRSTARSLICFLLLWSGTQTDNFFSRQQQTAERKRERERDGQQENRIERERRQLREHATAAAATTSIIRQLAARQLFSSSSSSTVSLQLQFQSLEKRKRNKKREIVDESVCRRLDVLLSAACFAFCLLLIKTFSFSFFFFLVMMSMLMLICLCCVHTQTHTHRQIVSTDCELRKGHPLPSNGRQSGEPKEQNRNSNEEFVPDSGKKTDTGAMAVHGTQRGRRQKKS